MQSHNDLWERLFFVTFQPVSTNSLVYLEQLSKELTKEGNSWDHVTPALIDRVIISVCAQSKLPNPHMNLLDYFLRVFKESFNIKQNNSYYWDSRLIDGIIESIISYSKLVIKYPQKFPLTNFGEPGAKIVISLLESWPEIDTPIIVEFINNIVERSVDKEIVEMFQPVFEELSTKILASFILDPFQSSFQALKILLSNKKLLNILLSLPRWIPEKRKTGKEMEVFSILGPFFRFTTISPTIPIEKFFPEPYNNDKKSEFIESLRSKIKLSQKNCFDILNTIINSSYENREKVLEWIAAILNRNRDRLKMNVDRISVCSDGFLINLTSVLLLISHPFLSREYESSIDTEYLYKYDRIIIPNDITRLSILTDAYQSYISTIRHKDLNDKLKSTPNFVTECFYLTLQALHLGLTKSLAILERPHWQDARSVVLIESQMLDPELLNVTFKFYNFFASLLIRIAVPGLVDGILSLPLKEPPPVNFASIPEYFLEDFVDFLTFLFLRPNENLENLDNIMSFLVIFISSTAFVKNPHLRGKFIDVLGLLTPKNLKSPIKKDPFNHHLAEQYLGPALIQYYIDIEITGASTQFYDKFNGRFYVALVMRHIWKLPNYRESFKNVFSNPELSLRFTNMLMNDSIFLLDECFSKLYKIHQNEQLFASPQWNLQPNQQERQVEHVQMERMVKTFLLLSSEVVRMFQYITHDMNRYFVRPELSDRIAAMLNYFLVQLVGPKHEHLMVHRPEKYNFQPNWFLKKIVQTYLNFSDYEEFYTCIVRDGRSYSSEVFQAAMKKLSLINPPPSESIIKRFVDFSEKVERKAKEEAAKQEIIGDIPDEFLDPLLQTLMTNPVKLPTSNVTLDRSTITRHLLSTPTDPFTRDPLSLEDLIPDVELKNKIEQWLQNRNTKSK